MEEKKVSNGRKYLNFLCITQEKINYSTMQEISFCIVKNKYVFLVDETSEIIGNFLAGSDPIDADSLKISDETIHKIINYLQQKKENTLQMLGKEMELAKILQERNLPLTNNNHVRDISDSSKEISRLCTLISHLDQQINYYGS